jgi:hypothetical protein
MPLVPGRNLPAEMQRGVSVFVFGALALIHLGVVRVTKGYLWPVLAVCVLASRGKVAVAISHQDSKPANVAMT